MITAKLLAEKAKPQADAVMGVAPAADHMRRAMGDIQVLLMTGARSRFGTL